MAFKEVSVPITDLIGKILVKVEVNSPKDGISFQDSIGNNWDMYHAQSCCESVSIEDICGDIQDLIFSPILDAYESSNIPNVQLPDYGSESFTWTFYVIRSMKGTVTIRWYGSSNGYYSEEVSFTRQEQINE